MNRTNFATLCVLPLLAACSGPADGTPTTGSTEAVPLASGAPAASAAAPSDPAAASSATVSVAPSGKAGVVCVETAPPTSIPPTPTDAIAATLDAWSAVHAEAAAVAGVIGLPCATSADCDTGDAAFPGSCQTPYYGQAQCSVPSAPAEPLFTCADYSCPVGFQCEQELGASVACVQRHQTCTAPAGAASTGKHHGEGGG